MRYGPFSATMALVSACAQAQVAGTSSPPTPPVRGAEQSFELKPTTHVCVSASVSDDIPGPNHVGITNDNRSNAFGGDIVDRLEAKSKKFADVIEQFHLIPRTWPAACKAEADAILIDIRYTLNPNGKPFRVHWSVSQGSRRIEQTTDRDISAEIAAGADIGSTTEEPIGAAIGNDMNVRATEIAALLK